jgi:hypothetical protein
VAVWPMVDGKAAVIRGIGVPSIYLAPAKSGEPNPYSGDKAEAALKDIADLGFNVAKVWAFPNHRGLKLNKDGGVTGIEDATLKNLSDLVERARANKIQLYISLNDDFSGLAKSPLDDKKSAESYAKSVLVPVTRKLKGNEGVFAFDLMSAVEQEATAKVKDRTWDVVRTYLKTATDFIKKEDPQRLVSAGPVNVETLQGGKLAGLGLDFYSFVRMDDKGALPDPAALKLDRPVMVGMMSQSSNEKNDELQSNALKTFIRNADAANYAGFVIWNYSSRPEDAASSIIGSDGKHRPAADVIKSTIAETRK